MYDLPNDIWLHVLTAVIGIPEWGPQPLGETPGELAALHLAELVDEFAWTAPKDDTLHRDSRIWLRGAIAARILQTAFLATDDPQTATRLGQALEQLDFLINDTEQP